MHEIYFFYLVFVKIHSSAVNFANINLYHFSQKPQYVDYILVSIWLTCLALQPAITPFIKVIRDHRYQSAARVRLPIDETKWTIRVLSRALHELWQHAGDIFAFDRGCLLTHSLGGESKTRNKRHQSVVRRNLYFDILDLPCESHPCNRQSDGQNR